MRRSTLLAAALIALTVPTACDSLNDERIPSLPVSINLSDAGLWNTYGVEGFGVCRFFIKGQQPAGFPYTANSYTGFGGVLLIGGMDPYTGNTNAKLAYDLACPVEMKPDVRVAVRDDDFMAVCPICGSVYDVTMAGGAPVSGPASSKNNRYSLRRYQVLATQYGGYMIVQ